eukprot:4050878-Pyramimonas_sp.AAC.1
MRWVGPLRLRHVVACVLRGRHTRARPHARVSKSVPIGVRSMPQQKACQVPSSIARALDLPPHQCHRVNAIMGNR